MQEQLRSRVIGVLINVIDARSIKRAGAPDDPVNFVSFGKQQFRQVRSILARYSGDECAFHALGPSSMQRSNLSAQQSDASSGCARTYFANSSITMAAVNGFVTCARLVLDETALPASSALPLALF